MYLVLCPVTENRQLHRPPVPLLHSHLWLLARQNNHSVSISSHSKGTYVKVDTETCTRRLKYNAERSHHVHIISSSTPHTLHKSVRLKHTFACFCRFFWILSDKLWQPHTVEEASEDKHWFQTNLPRHLLFLVRYTFPRLMSSHLYSPPSEMFFFMPCVSKHQWFITIEEQWKKKWWKNEYDG